MRFSVGVLTCLGVGAMSLALADPPATPPAQSAVAEPAAAAATPPAPATTAPAPAPAAAPQTAPTAFAPAAPDAEEKRLLAMGYKMQMRNGEKVFCRREPVLGSRLEGKLICGTPQDLITRAEQNRENVERAQHLGTTRNPGQ